MIIKNSKLYDVLKWFGRYCLPALVTMYVALSKAWNWDYTAEIVATIGAVNVCLNTLLGISNENYDKNAESVEGEL